MSAWELPKLFDGLHKKIHLQLQTAREAIQHSTAKGDVSQNAWIGLLEGYLPKRYAVATAFVIDSRNNSSDQIDVVIYDRQYSPLVFETDGAKVVPAESVYAVFEAKQSMDATTTKYAKDKAASVRRLFRTSLAIPHAGGTYAPKPPIPILAGILAFESGWSPPMADTMLSNLVCQYEDERLNLGCVSSHGYFRHDSKTNKTIPQLSDKAVTAFLLELISQLQLNGTVQMMDIGAYAAWLSK